MSARLARLLVGLYPLAFRRRYAEEMLALLEESPPRLGQLVDLLRGVAREHLRPSGAGREGVTASERVRAGASGLFATWVLFCTAGLGFYKTAENDGPLSRAHALLGTAHAVVQWAAAVAIAASIAGAAPILLTALAETRRRRELRRWLALPLAGLAAEALITLGLVAAVHSASGVDPLGVSLFGAWALGGVAVAVLCVVAARRVIFALSIAPARLAATLPWAGVLASAMLVIAAATAVYAVALYISAPAAAGAPNGPLGLIGTGASVVLQAVWMLVLAGFGLLSLRRALGARAGLA